MNNKNYILCTEINSIQLGLGKILVFEIDNYWKNVYIREIHFIGFTV